MATNPLGAYAGDSGDENDSQNDDSGELAACEQKIAGLETRVSAIEAKLGMSESGQGTAKAPMISKNPSGKMPFFGG